MATRAGRHGADTTFPAFNVDTIEVLNGEQHQAWSGETIVLHNGGTIDLPDLTGGHVRVVPPRGIRWDNAVNGGPVVSTALTLDSFPLGSRAVDLLLPAGATTWSSIYFDDWPVNVKDFGAVGDGITDDTAAIQAAIDSLPDGGAVYFPVGTYAISAPITVQRDAVWLIGEGHRDRLETDAVRNGSVIRPLATFTGTDLVRFESDNADGRPVQGGGMRDITVNGWRNSATPPAGAVNGIYARIARGNFIGVSVNECTGTGIVVEGARISQGDGVDWDTYDTKFARCEVYRNAVHGVRISEHGGSDTHWTNCVVFTNDLCGMLIDGASTQVTSCHVYGNLADGIQVRNVRTWLVGCKIEENDEHGLHFRSLAAEGARFWGQFIVNACGFKGNSRAAANTSDDIYLEADQSNGFWQINGCRLSQVGSTPRYGINIVDGTGQANQGIVTGNLFSGTYGTARILLGGPTTNAFRNRVMANRGIEDDEDGPQMMAYDGAAYDQNHTGKIYSQVTGNPAPTGQNVGDILVVQQ